MSGHYRADIDGMRAVAVTAVVLFHAGVPGVSGGFTGVDIFFVISGYLITGILFRELAGSGRISLIGFYARRFGRILPSLLLVTGVTVVAGAALLSSTLFEVHELTKSAVAALLFVANLYFHNATGNYFAPAAEQMPLLHTWSLGVEEQYYLLWPLLLIGAARLASAGGNLRSLCRRAIGAVTIVSLTYCVLVTPGSPSHAFYMPMSRFWELGVGSMLALSGPDRATPRIRTGTAAALAGVALIAAGMLLAREGELFPFPLGLLPVVGTALVIYGNGIAATNPVARLLASRPLVSIGLVSYAWYLWHWPPLAFARVLAADEPSATLRFTLVAGSLAAAFATVRWWEAPLRQHARRARPRRAVVGGTAATVALILFTTATYGAARSGMLPEDPRIAAAFTDRPPLQQACLRGTAGDAGDPPAPCLARAGRPRVVVWGDSHADQWVPAVAAWAGQNGWQVEQLTVAACPPLLGLLPKGDMRTRFAPDERCAQANRGAAERIAGTGEPTIVVMAANWAPRGGVRLYPGVAPLEPSYFDVRARSWEDSRRALGEGLKASFAYLTKQGAPVVLVLQSPTMPSVPATCVIRSGERSCGLVSADFRARVGILGHAMRRTAEQFPRVGVIDPAEVLCPGDSCPAEIEGRIAYYDLEHVATSVAASPRSLAVWGPVLDAAALHAGSGQTGSGRTAQARMAAAADAADPTYPR